MNHIIDQQPEASQHARRSIRQVVVRLLLIAVIWQIGNTVAQAQIGFGSPNDRPTFSPYLNLFRRNNRSSTVLNYYGLVRPQNRAIQQNQQLNRGLYNLQQQSQQPDRLGQRTVPRYSQMGITGHPTAFMTIGAGTAASGSGGGAFSPIGGSFANDGVGLGVDVGAVGGGSIGAGGGFNQGAAGGFVPPVVGQAAGGAVGGFGGATVPGGYGGYGLGTVTGHPSTYGVGIGSGGVGFGNQ